MVLMRKAFTTDHGCVTRCTQDHLRIWRRENRLHIWTMDRTDQKFRWTDCRDDSSRGIWRRLPPSMRASVLLQSIFKKLQGTAIRLLCNVFDVGLHASLGVVAIATGLTNDIEYCLQTYSRYRNWTNEWHRILLTDEFRSWLWINDGRGRVQSLPGWLNLAVHIAAPFRLYTWDNHL